MALKTERMHLTNDLAFRGVHASNPNGYDDTTVPSNEIKITASDGVTSDWFASSVAVGSGRIVVGAWGDDDNGETSGSAYIFDTEGNQLTKITASDGAANDRFGFSVAVGSGRIVVGANRGDSAYIFDLNGNEITKITGADTAPGDDFGVFVAVGCGRIVVGARLDDDAGTYSGSAYVFDLDGNQVAKLTASDEEANDNYGWDVAVGCGRIVVGSAYTDDNGTDSGSVYIYDLDGNELAKITASDNASSDVFGNSVAVGSGRIVVGSSGDDDNFSNSGSAYIFDLDGNQLTKITASDGASRDFFGNSVAVGNGRIVVGAYGDDDNGLTSGSAYVFDLDGNELAKITASDGATDDRYGTTVAVGSGRIVVGSNWDRDNGDYSGSAYIYTTPDNKSILDILDEM